MTDRRSPFYGKCTACGHAWIVHWLPMEITRAAQAMKRATCPCCGETKRIMVAKQSNGELEEPSADPREWKAA